MGKEKQSLKLIGTVVLIPFFLAVPPVAGWFLGSWIEEKWGISPSFRFFCILVGFIVGCREVYKILRALEKDSL